VTSTCRLLTSAHSRTGESRSQRRCRAARNAKAKKRRLAEVDKSVKWRRALPNLPPLNAAPLPPVALASSEEPTNPTAAPRTRSNSNGLDPDHPLPPHVNGRELSGVYPINQLIAAKAICEPLGRFAKQHPPPEGHVRNSGADASAASDTSYRIAHEMTAGSELHVLVSQAAAPILELLECEETGWAALESRQVPSEADTPPIQAAHYDFSQSCVKRHHDAQSKAHKRATYPWTLLVALSAEARLIVYRRGRRSCPRVVRLPLPGDAVLFRGDVWHGGDTYRAANWRYHMYLEPSTCHTTKEGLFEVQKLAVSPTSEEGWHPKLHSYPTGTTLYTGPVHQVADLRSAIL
jgi:hypothetical protein